MTVSQNKKPMFLILAMMTIATWAQFPLLVTAAAAQRGSSSGVLTSTTVVAAARPHIDENLKLAASVSPPLSPTASSVLASVSSLLPTTGLTANLNKTTGFGILTASSLNVSSYLSPSLSTNFTSIAGVNPTTRLPSGLPSSRFATTKPSSPSSSGVQLNTSVPVPPLSLKPTVAPAAKPAGLPQ